MATIGIKVEHVAKASFTVGWEEANALHHALPRLRKHLKQEYGIENLQMRFVNPWGGVNHTEFYLVVELAKGVTAATAAAVTKWLLDWGKDFLKEYRKKNKNAASRGSKKKNRPAIRR